MPWTGLFNKETCSQQLLYDSVIRQVESSHALRVHLLIKRAVGEIIASDGMETILDFSIVGVVIWPKLSYKIHVSTVIKSCISKSTEGRLDSVESFSSINASLKQETWTQRVEITNLRLLQTKKKKSVLDHGTIPLHLQSSSPAAQVWFEVTSVLAVSLLLDMSFTDNFIRDTISNEQKVVPWQLKRVTILFSCHRRAVTTDTLLAADDLPEPGTVLSHT